ncbi:homeobox domain-containing protein, partial [Dimargaris cristalligena]
KKRKRLTPEKLTLLCSVFAHEQKPNAEKRKQLSDQTGMTPREVQVWFQNRRAKYKR